MSQNLFGRRWYIVTSYCNLRKNERNARVICDSLRTAGKQVERASPIVRGAVFRHSYCSGMGYLKGNIFNASHGK